MSSLDRYEKAQRKRVVAAIKSIMTANKNNVENRTKNENSDEKSPKRTEVSNFANRRNRHKLSLRM